MGSDPEQAVAELTAQLVRIESVNPGPAGDDIVGRREADISQFVVDWLRWHGVEAERHEFLPGRFNVVAAIKGSGNQRLLFDAHTDTVPAENVEGDPFSGAVRDGRVFGRGACDDKGALAAMMCAMASLAQDGCTPPATIELLASGDEEGTFAGIRHWVNCGGKADGAIVGEPTDVRLVTASRGALRCKIRTLGKAAHTAVPEQGVNAVVHMTRVICALEEKLKPRLSAVEHPLAGRAHVTITMIRGGRRVNIVPDECEIELELRLVPGQTRAGALAQLDAVLAEVPKGDSFAEVERVEPYGFAPPAECPIAHPLAANAARALRSEGLSDEPRGAAYTTHASVLAEAGIPCVIIGPGSIGQAHSPDEWVEIDQLEAAVRVYRRIMTSFEGSDA